MNFFILTMAGLVSFGSFAAHAQTQPPSPIEQRLGATIGALIVENSRLAIALDEANKTIAQLQGQLKSGQDKQ